MRRIEIAQSVNAARIYQAEHPFSKTIFAKGKNLRVTEGTAFSRERPASRVRPFATFFSYI